MSEFPKQFLEILGVLLAETKHSTTGQNSKTCANLGGRSIDGPDGANYEITEHH